MAKSLIPGIMKGELRMFNQYGLLMKSGRSGTSRTIKDPELGKFLYDLYIACGADLTDELNSWCMDGSDSCSCFYMPFDYGRKSYTGKEQHILPTYGFRGISADGVKYINQYFQKYEDIMGGAFVDYVFGTDYINPEELSKYNQENETVERMRQKLWGISHVVEKPDLICRIMERVWAAKESDPETRILIVLENAGEESLNLLRQLYLLLPQGLRARNGFETNIRREDLDVIARDDLPISILTADKAGAAGLDKKYLKGLRFPVEIIKLDEVSTYPCDQERVGQLKHHCERMSVVTERYLNYAEWTAMNEAGRTQSSFSIYSRIWELREELYSGKNQEAASFTGIPGQKMETGGQKSGGKQGDKLEVLVPKREMDELNEKYISLKRGKTRVTAARNLLGILAAVFAAAGVAMAVIFGVRIRMLQDTYTEQEEKLQSQEAEVKSLSQRLKERESEAADLSQQLEARESEAADLSQQLEARESEAADLSQQLEDKKTETASLSEQLEGRESEAAELSQRLKDRESEAAELSQQLEGRESEATSLSDLSQQLEARESEAAELSQQLKERESEAAELSRQLKERESEAADLSQQLEDSKSEAADLSQQLEDSKSEAAGLSQQLEDSKSEAAELSQQLQDSRSEAAGLSEQLEEERSKNEGLPAETGAAAEVQPASSESEAQTDAGVQTEADAESQPGTEPPAQPQTEPYVPLGILY